MQPIYMNEENKAQFLENEIVRALVNEHNAGLNIINRSEFSDEDRMQLLQLIGYAVNGFLEYDFISEDVRDVLNKEIKVGDSPIEEITQREKSKRRLRFLLTSILNQRKGRNNKFTMTVQEALEGACTNAFYSHLIEQSENYFISKKLVVPQGVSVEVKNELDNNKNNVVGFSTEVSHELPTSEEIKSMLPTFSVPEIKITMPDFEQMRLLLINAMDEASRILITKKIVDPLQKLQEILDKYEYMEHEGFAGPKDGYFSDPTQNVSTLEPLTKSVQTITLNLMDSCQAALQSLNLVDDVDYKQAFIEQEELSIKERRKMLALEKLLIEFETVGEESLAYFENTIAWNKLSDLIDKSKNRRFKV